MTFTEACNEIFRRLSRAGVNGQFGYNFSIEIRHNCYIIRMQQSMCCYLSVYFYTKSIKVYSTLNTINHNVTIEYLWADNYTEIDDMYEFISFSRKWFSELFHLVSYVRYCWEWYVKGMPYYCDYKLSLEDIFLTEWYYDKNKDVMEVLLAELVTKKNRRLLGRVK